MEMNVVRPLFLVNFDFEIKQVQEEDDNIDPKDSMFECQCLIVVTIVITTSIIQGLRTSINCCHYY
jgi:hypothetical protein